MKIAEEIAGQKMYSKDDMALILSEAAVEIDTAIDDAKLQFDQELKRKCRAILEATFLKHL